MAEEERVENGLGAGTIRALEVAELNDFENRLLGPTSRAGEGVMGLGGGGPRLESEGQKRDRKADHGDVVAARSTSTRRASSAATASATSAESGLAERLSR